MMDTEECQYRDPSRMKKDVTMWILLDTSLLVVDEKQNRVLMHNDLVD